MSRRKRQNHPLAGQSTRKPPRARICSCQLSQRRKTIRLFDLLKDPLPKRKKKQLRTCQTFTKTKGLISFYHIGNFFFFPFYFFFFFSVIKKKKEKNVGKLNLLSFLLSQLSLQ